MSRCGQPRRIFNRNPQLPFYTQIEPLYEITPPLGYLIPRQWTDAIEVIRQHGVKIYRTAEVLSDTFECYRLYDATFDVSPYEGRQRATYQIKATVEGRSFQIGSAYIPLACPESRMNMHLLEPQAPDPLLKWGFFNSIFEQKEYFEPYAMKPIAERMMKEDVAE